MTAPRWVSPLRYPGGKVRMTGWLVEVFDHLLGPMDVEVWIEPFGGGAGAALMALEAHEVPEAWIVEANPAVAAFWTTIMADDGRLAARVEATTPTLELFLHSREIVAAALAGNDIDRDELGYAAFIVNRCSRSGMVLGNVGPIGGRQQAARYTVESRFPSRRLADRIRAVAAFGRRFRVFEGDGIERIEDLTGSGIEDEVFLFVDPPYLGVGNRLYAQGMQPQCHERLATALQACPAPWVLTYDAHPGVLELYPRNTVLEFDSPHTANRQKIGTEYLVISDGLATPTEHPLGKGRHWQVA
ncbi:DNA adenine methylase [Dietzia sp. 179-F 9C3 NHS]|uniref:DNA adenine methylase n=1 Tax=Dietzia sp. 179-F 9C3 NHS TaxID=3374295 RepID=UPI0038799B7B